jgi:hypothetical protein
MLWKIEKAGDVMWYTSDMCQLRLKEEADTVNIWINYKGYNIVMPMEMWGFSDEVSERGITYDIAGDKMESWYFVIPKKDLRIFVDLVYFFIQEQNADMMINSDLFIDKWE